MGTQGAINGLRTDGQEFPIEASISQTQTDGQTLYTVILRDITERTRTESALTQSEERLRLALTAANQGLYDLNVQTGTCVVSPEYALMLGYDPAEFRETNAAWRERLHPDDREAVYRAYEDYVAGRRNEYRVEFRQRTKAGDWKWISSVGRLVSRSADGRPLRMLGIHTDITERKKASERDVARAHTLRQLSELGLQLTGTPDEIFRHTVRIIGELFAVRVVCLSEIAGANLSFRAVYVNGEVFSNAGGCPLDVTPCATVEGTKDIRLYDRVAERFPQASFLRDHKAYAYCGIPSLDGEGHVVAVTCLLNDKPREFSEEDQDILRIIGQRIATELERARTEESLQANEVRLTEAQRLAQIGNWELDLDSASLTWSDEIFRIFELDPAEFGASYEAFLDAVHPEDRDLVNKAYRTSLETREPYEIVHRLRMADGRIKYVQEHGQTFYDDATGRPLRSTGTVQDITTLKLAELRIEASLREKETLLREVHHRVKNNLQIISSLLHFQAKKAQQGQEESIFTEGHDRLRAMILVHELLYRSTDLHRVPLGKYLTTLTDQLRRSFRETTSGVHLRVEADALSVPAAIALPCGMIVTELVTNAFKYAYPDNTSGPLLVRIAIGEESFLLSVSDEGVGLPAKFDLAQTDSFGLHLVVNLANQLGATLTRPPGSGTNIVLTVPLPSSAVDPKRPMDTPVQPLHQSESFL